MRRNFPPGIIEFADEVVCSVALATSLQTFGMVLVEGRPPSRTQPVERKRSVFVANIPFVMRPAQLQFEIADLLRKAGPDFNVRPHLLILAIDGAISRGSSDSLVVLTFVLLLFLCV